MTNKFAAFLLLAMTACSADLEHASPFDPASPLEKQAKSELVGKVVLTGETDFSQVSLKLQNDKRTYSFDTEKDGSVRLTGVVPGRYKLRATARYFENAEADVEVALGEAYDFGSLTLDPLKAAVQGSAIAESLAGKAKIASGGVVVSLTRTGSIRGAATSAPVFRTAAEERPTSFTTVSSNQGDYVFIEVPAGVYQLEASQGALDPVTVASIQVTGEDGAVTVAPVILAAVDGFIEAVGTVKGEDSEVLSQTAAVRLKLYSVNAEKMRLGSARGTDPALCVPGAAQPIATTAVVNLTQQGPHVFCAVFVSKDGRESPVSFDQLTYDATPPALASVSVNGGATYTRTTPLTLALSSADATSGVEKMVVATDAAFTGATPQDYVPVLAYPVSGDGAKTIYVKFIDRAGNEKSAYPATITVDTIDPILSSFTVQDAAGNPVGSSISVTRVYLALGSVELNPGVQMMIANAADFGGGVWQPFQSQIAWDLVPSTAAAGVDRTIYVRLRDAAGNISLTGTQTVHIDTVAPANPVINLPAGPETTPTVTVNLSASGADKVELSPNPSFDNPVSFGYATVTSYTFTGGDGVKTLYARFLDDAGNVSAVIADTVTLDRTGPELGTVAVNGGNPYVTASVPVEYQVASFTSGDKLQVATEATFAAPALFTANPGLNSVTYSLAGPDGAKTLYLRGVDALGNPGAMVSFAVTRDTAPPSVTSGNAVVIEGGDDFATGRFVSVDFPVSGASQMLLSEDASFAGAAWEPFVTSTLWVLSTGDAIKTLHAKFRDAAGNTIGTYADTITLDTSAPSNPALVINSGAAYATTTAVTVSLSAVGASQMQLSNDGIFDTEPVQPYSFGNAAWTLSSGDGVKAVYVRYLDAAGNSSPVASAFVILDTKSPVVNAGSILVDGGAQFTNHPLGSVTLTLNAAEAAEVYLSEGSCGVGGSWMAYSPVRTFNTSLTEGTKVVWARFRDPAGNISACSWDSIVRDTQLVAPGIAASLTGWEAITGRTASQQVTLSLTGLTADVDEMLVANDASYAGAGWVPVAASTAWFLTPGDGLKNVYVKVRDAAGNEQAVLTTLSATPSITLDQTAPATPALSVADIDNDGQALSSNSVELRWTLPTGMDSFELQRRRVGLDNDFALLSSPASVDSEFADAVTMPGYAHVYRIRASDDLGNQSDWSLPAEAVPFLPVSVASWIRSGTTTRYVFPPNQGTFLLGASYLYEDSDGIGYTDVLPTNLTSWERAIPSTDRFAEKLRVRTQNQDSSLVYESLFGIGYNERDTALLSPPVQDILGQATLVIDSNDVEHLAYLADDWTYHVTKRVDGAWLPATQLFDGDGNSPIALVKDASDHLYAAFGVFSPVQALVVARNDGLALRDTFEWPFGTSNWSLVSAGVERNTLAIAPPSGTSALNLDGGNDVLESATLPAVTLHYSYAYERQGGGDAPEGADALYFEAFDGAVWSTLQTHGPADGSNTAFTVVTGNLPAGTIKVRFRSEGGGEGTDDWFVDDVRISADDGTWVSQIVDTGNQAGRYPKIAVDSQGGLHVSYGDDTSILYAGWVTNAWETRVMGTTNLANSHDIAVNSADEPTIVYWKAPPYQLEQAVLSGGVWTSSVVPNNCTSPSMQFDLVDDLHLICRNNTALDYGKRSGGVWGLFTMLEADAAGYDLVVDNSGKLHAGFSRSSGALWFGTDESGAWESFELGGGESVYSVSLQRTSLGRNTIAYREANTKSIRLASYAIAGWQPWSDEDIDLTGNTGAVPALMLAPGKLGVAYRRDDSFSIQYAEKTLAGWNTETVADDADYYGGCLGAAYTADGKAHLVYDNFTAHDIIYATNETNVWTTEVIEVGGWRLCGLLVDKADRIHTVYLQEPDTIRHQMRVNGVWQAAETVVSGIDPNDMAFTLDKNDNLHVFYRKNTGAMAYVNNIGGTWSTPQSFGSVYCSGCGFALVIDDQLKAHAIDAGASGLRHWTNSSGTWTVEAVDGVGGMGAFPSAVIDAQGKLHLFYKRQQALRYATNLSGRWAYSDLIRGGYEAGGYSSAVIDDAGKFYLAYMFSPVYWPADNDLKMTSGTFSGLLPVLGISRTSPF